MNNIKSLLIILILVGSQFTFAQEFPRGILPGTDELYDEIPQKAPLTRSFYEGAPRSFSLKKFAPYPKSQGQYGTCTGWAVAYAARTILESQKKGWSDRSYITTKAFSPTYQYRLNASSSTCSGAFTAQVVASLKSKGSVPMSDFYVTSGSELCPGAPMHYSNDDRASKYRIEEFTKLWGSDMYSNSLKIQRTKTSLSEGNPVVISMICPDSFDRPSTYGVWNPTESPNSSTNGRQHGRHAMCVVGYDNDKFGGAFEVQNSWGANWGNSGYVWIRYDDFARFTYQAFELVQFSPPEPEEPLLAGSLRLFDMDDQIDLKVELAAKTRNWNVFGPEEPTEGEYTYKVVPRLLSQSKMRMFLKSEQPAFVYMLGTGSVDKSINKLFPVDQISPALNYSSSEIALPSEEHYFQMDNQAGKDYILIFFSKERLDIDEIKRKLSNSTGPISARLKNTIQADLINHQYITFDQNEIKFEVKQNSSGKKAFAMIVQFEHVN